MMARRVVVPPVAFDQLVFAYGVAGAAATGATPQSGVGGMGINIAEDDGAVSRIELTDIPVNRAAIAVRNQFPDGTFQPIMMRLWALGEIMRWPEAAAYRRPAPDNPNQEEISEALFKVAATMPLNPKGNFNRKTYYKRVAEEFAKNPD